MTSIDEADEVLGEQECRRLLGAGGIGRVAYTSGALPAVQPVAYAMLDDAVIFPARAGGSFAHSVRGAVLAFEVDAYDRTTGRGWSVTVVGRSHVAPVSGDMAPGGAEVWLVVVQARLITGRRSTLPPWGRLPAAPEPTRP